MVFGWVFFLIPLGGQAPHVLTARMGVHRTCGKPNEIEVTIRVGAHRLLYIPLSGQLGVTVSSPIFDATHGNGLRMPVLKRGGGVRVGISLDFVRLARRAHNSQKKKCEAPQWAHVRGAKRKQKSNWPPVLSLIDRLWTGGEPRLIGVVGIDAGRPNPEKEQ